MSFTAGRLLAVGFALWLSACATVPQLYLGQLSRLDKGLTAAGVQDRLGQAPLETRRVSVNGRDFDFHRYWLNNGLQLDRYFVAYEGGRVVYWGYLNEFRRQPDGDLALATGVVVADLIPAPGR